jgi:hypothetical protein
MNLERKCCKLYSGLFFCHNEFLVKNIGIELLFSGFQPTLEWRWLNNYGHKKSGDAGIPPRAGNHRGLYLFPCQHRAGAEPPAHRRLRKNKPVI